MRTRILLTVLATLASTALVACGATTTRATRAPTQLTKTVVIPTTNVPAPTSVPYTGPQGVPIETGPFLASASTTRLGRIVDGIQCQGLQQLAYRVYAHLQVYVDGHARALPGGIGLVDPTAVATSSGLLFTPQACFYWLHTRAADGVIQVESPKQRGFTLGDFFEVWGQPLSRDRVATTRGKVTAIVDGKRWREGPAGIPLKEHESIELAVAGPVPVFRALDWSGTGF